MERKPDRKQNGPCETPKHCKEVWPFSLNSIRWWQPEAAGQWRRSMDIIDAMLDAGIDMCFVAYTLINIFFEWQVLMASMVLIMITVFRRSL